MTRFCFRLHAIAALLLLSANGVSAQPTVNRHTEYGAIPKRSHSNNGEHSKITHSKNTTTSDLQKACNLALAYEEKGFFNLAEESWKSAIISFPNSPEPAQGLLRHYSKVGDRPSFLESARYFRGKFGYQSQFALPAVQDLIERREFDQSYELAKAHFEKNQNFDSVMIFVIVALLGNGHKPKALDLSTLVLSRDDSPKSQFLHTLCLIANDKSKEAEQRSLAQWRASPRNPLPVFGLVQALVQQKKEQEAMNFLREHFLTLKFDHALAAYYVSLTGKFGTAEEALIPQLLICLNDLKQPAVQETVSTPSLTSVQGSELARKQMHEHQFELLQTNKRKLAIILSLIQPDVQSKLIERVATAHNSQKMAALSYLLMGSCLRTVRQIPRSKSVIAKGQKLLVDFDTQREMSVYLDKDAVEPDIALGCYQRLQGAYPLELGRDSLVQRRMKQLRRWTNDPAFAAKNCISKFIYDYRIKDLIEGSDRLDPVLKKLAVGLDLDSE